LSVMRDHPLHEPDVRFRITLPRTFSPGCWHRRAHLLRPDRRLDRCGLRIPGGGVARRDGNDEERSTKHRHRVMYMSRLPSVPVRCLPDSCSSRCRPDLPEDSSSRACRSASCHRRSSRS
jgi:hypothetical protein